MTDYVYYLQFVGNILIAVAYIFGALALLFPDGPQMFQPNVALGIILLTTGLFGSPYSTFFKKKDDEAVNLLEGK
jgi:hypothetical protein